MLKEIGIDFPIIKRRVQQYIISEFLISSSIPSFSSKGFTISRISAWGFAVAPTTSFVVSPFDCLSAPLSLQPATIPISRTKQHNSANTFYSSFNLLILSFNTILPKQLILITFFYY